MDTRAYLQWCIDTHQARKEIIRRRLTKAGYVLVMIGAAGLWIVGWMFG